MATDVDSAVTFALVAQGQKGVAVVNVDGSFSYTPSANSNGADSFSYAVSDGAVTTAALVVSVSITAVNDAPVATAATIVVDEDGVFTGQAAGTDVDDDALVFALAQAPENGTAVVGANGALSYTPDADFNGADSFTFTVSDDTATSAPATISVTVTPVDELDCVATEPTTYAWRGAPDSAIDDCDAWDPRGRPRDVDSVAFDGTSGPVTFTTLRVKEIELLAGFTARVDADVVDADVVALAGGTLGAALVKARVRLTVDGDHLPTGVNVVIGDATAPGTASLTSTATLTVERLTFEGDQVVVGRDTRLVVQGTWRALGRQDDDCSRQRGRLEQKQKAPRGAFCC